MEDLKALIGEDEQVLYSGKPYFWCYLLECIFNPMLPIAFVWGLIDFGILGTVMFSSDEMGGMGFVIIPFMLLHLMPVWIYLAGVVTVAIKYRNTNYIVTDKGIYISSGIISMRYDSKPFMELSHINLHRGVFDQIFGVGDVVATTSQTDEKGRSVSMGINSIKDYAAVYAMIKKLQEDIYTDVMYPNDLRPGANHGYKTEYKG